MSRSAQARLVTPVTLGLFGLCLAADRGALFLQPTPDGSQVVFGGATQWLPWRQAPSEPGIGRLCIDVITKVTATLARHAYASQPNVCSHKIHTATPCGTGQAERDTPVKPGYAVACLPLPG